MVLIMYRVTCGRQVLECEYIEEARDAARRFAAEAERSAVVRKVTSEYIAEYKPDGSKYLEMGDVS